MNLWTAIVAIVAIVGVMQVSKYWLESRQTNNDDQRLKAREAQIEDLQARVQTLETIITDKSEVLKRQIDDI